MNTKSFCYSVLRVYNAVRFELNITKIKLLCVAACLDSEVIIYNKEICLTITPSHGNLTPLLCLTWRQIVMLFWNVGNQQ